MYKSVFTISLDFELHWGGFEKWSLNKDFKKYFQNTRNLIPELIELFEKYEIHTSWATVGILMHESLNDLNNHIPKLKPEYRQQQLSAYHYIEHNGIGSGEEDDPHHFADSLVKQIVDAPYQELASHSFAHYYCNESGQNVDQFDADCKAISASAKTYGVKLQSLVFPRNQFNSEYLKVCTDNGIKIIRSNPVDWWWKIDSTSNESFWKRLNRGLDAYFQIGGKTSYPASAIKKVEGIYLLPASRLLRPYNPKELFLNRLKINKIKKEMTIAAKNGEYYHLWWHPHNFGLFPEKSMEGLKEILNHFQFLKEKFDMRSMSMKEIAEELDKTSYNNSY